VLIIPPSPQMIDYNNNLHIFFYALLFLLLLFVLIVVLFDIFQEKIFENEVKKDLEIKFQKKHMQSIIMMQEQERERFAQDLHDEISSKLNLLSLHLYSLKSPKKTESQKLDIIDDIIQINDRVIENSRRTAHNLLPPVLEKFGLNEAIIELILDFKNIKRVSINYQNKIEFNSSGFDVQLQIFRIIQELINNSLKHGKATNINIEFALQNNKHHCLYKDNGFGFDVSKLHKRKGLGMQNIENRIELLNGTFAIDSVINKGTQVVFNFDL
jgi:two-component system, NarL family, sensor kinase